MDANQFLTSLGWPTERLEECGSAIWSGSGTEEMSTIRATISRLPQSIEARVEFIGLEATESMLVLSASVEAGSASATSSKAGEPPEPIPAEDAAALFRHMSSGLGKFKFLSSGPLEYPKQKNGI